MKSFTQHHAIIYVSFLARGFELASSNTNKGFPFKWRKDAKYIVLIWVLITFPWLKLTQLFSASPGGR
jgi:hypothetical protein